MEYPIPMAGRRIDAVLLAHNVIVVIETKTGRTSAVRQVEGYALNLACFHEASSGRIIVLLYIPQPTLRDKSRLVSELDRTANFLLSCRARAFE